MFVGYAAVFVISGSRIDDAIADSARNLAALAVVAFPTAWALYRTGTRLSGAAGLAIHTTLAVLFALAWYLVLMISVGVVTARSWTDFDVRPVFPEPASIWQLSQGIAVYAALALAVALRIRIDATEPNAVAPGASAQPETSVRYFVRKDGDATPIDLDRIVMIRGADDYSEIQTVAGRHLVRLTLDRFEREFGSGRFCRVHRSVIVNIAQVDRFEPDGSGRMLVWMANGEQVRSSRAGAQRLRQRLI